MPLGIKKKLLYINLNLYLDLELQNLFKRSIVFEFYYQNRFRYMEEKLLGHFFQWENIKGLHNRITVFEIFFIVILIISRVYLRPHQNGAISPLH